jgi:hypothetical protein
MSSITNKRKYNNEYTMNNKLYSRKCVSASQIHNYFMDDPLLDFLNLHGERLGYKCDKETEYNFSNLIMNLGNVWEDKIVDHIRCLVGENNTAVVKDRNFQPFATSNSLVKSYISNRVPVIFQAYLRSEIYDNDFHGYVDVLCRTDYLDKIFESSDELSNVIADYKVKNIDYIPIDIKTSNFSSETINKIDTNYLQYMQGQIHIYSKMNNENSKYGLLLGRQLVESGKKLTPYIVNVDNILVQGKIRACIAWLKKLEQEGKNWKILPEPSVSELYPNMKNSHDNKWRSVKKELADSLKEITSIYYCGYSKRRHCFNSEVYNYLDPEFEAVITSTFRNSPVIKSIGNTEGGKSVVNDIINITRVQNGKITESEIIPLQPSSKTQYIYIDIETVYNFYNCIYDEYTNIGKVDLERSLAPAEVSKNDFISQIGIGYINNNGNWIYRSFEMQLIDFNEENRIIGECKNYLQVVLDVCENICFVYYTKAENRILSTIIRQLIPQVDKPITLLDLHEEWCNRSIYLKNLLNFKLKSIIKALHQRGKTSLSYENLVVQDGSDAMALYMIEDKIAKDSGRKINESAITKLKAYNETDCKALYEVHKNLYKLV